MLRKKQFWIKLFICGIFLFPATKGFAQNHKDSLALRKKVVVGGNALGIGVMLTGLYQLWYKDYPQSKFHFINDNGHWNQMDKLGHAYSCYYEGLVGIEMMKWAGFSDKQSSWIGGSLGFLIQTSVEVMDGFSEEWGASLGDVAANASGTALVISQSLLWDEQRIKLKFSFSPSPYASYRPNTLGTSFAEQLLKDYNGQTYWLSGNINEFKPELKIPKWINIAVGYGSQGMLTGDPNDPNLINYPTSPRYRQFYLSPDIDLTKIPVKNKFLKSTFIVLNCLKFPMPAMEFSKDSRFHWLKF